MKMSLMSSNATMPTPAQHAVLARVAKRLDTARHGEKQAIVSEAAAELGVAMQTVHTWLRAHRYNPRKRRSDAGSTAVTAEEKLALASVVAETFRDNGKAGVSMKSAIAALRADGKIRAERVDTETGEILPLSDSTISRALKAARLSPRQLRQAPPHQRLRSLYPNHVWQVDASVCVLYYLPRGMDGKSEPGAWMMPIRKQEHYKNKLGNLKAIERFRVIRYVGTDHCSGMIRVWNYPHSESGAHTVAFLARMMAPKADPRDRFQGRPEILMVDPGATSAGMVRRFCDLMGIRLIVNSPHNPRAKGQVEQANNLWEREFEAWLCCIRRRISDFDELNRQAERFMLWFNDTAIHTRHAMSRMDKWLSITEEQLVTTASEKTLLALATGRSATPVVHGDLTVRFDGKTWPVRDVPGIVIGEKLEIAASPFVEGGAVAICRDQDGKLVHYPLTAEETDEHGFPVSAAVIGEEFKSPPETIIEENVKAIEKLVTGMKTLREAEKSRREKGFTPFGGEIDPFVRVTRHEEALKNVHPMPIPATPMANALPRVAQPPVPVIRAAARLRDAMGDAWNQDTYDWLVRKHPDGISEEALSRMIDNLETGDSHVAAM
jgi:hypothetical protein